MASWFVNGWQDGVFLPTIRRSVLVLVWYSKPSRCIYQLIMKLEQSKQRDRHRQLLSSKWVTLCHCLANSPGAPCYEGKEAKTLASQACPLRNTFDAVYLVQQMRRPREVKRQSLLRLRRGNPRHVLLYRSRGLG